MKDAVRKILEAIGENPDRKGLADTPSSTEDALREITAGYSQDAPAILAQAIAPAEYDQMVVCGNIDLYSVCERHLLPFHGRCHVAFIPDRLCVDGEVVAQVVDVFARRLQVQERLTAEIASSLMDALRPLGVGVVIEAFHLCMAMRGVEKQNCNLVTSSLLGCFRDESATRAEFMRLISR